MLTIYLNTEGMERHAKGESLYSWNYSIQVRQPNDEPYGKEKGDFLELATIDPVLPVPAACIVPVLAKLKAREDELRQETQAELDKLQQRRNDLLMIGHEVKNV